jgi:hypothetical protein
MTRCNMYKTKSFFLVLCVVPHTARGRHELVVSQHKYSRGGCEELFNENTHRKILVK